MSCVAWKRSTNVCQTGGDEMRSFVIGIQHRALDYAEDQTPGSNKSTILPMEKSGSAFHETAYNFEPPRFRRRGGSHISCPLPYIRHLWSFRTSFLTTLYTLAQTPAPGNYSPKYVNSNLTRRSLPASKLTESARANPRAIPFQISAQASPRPLRPKKKKYVGRLKMKSGKNR